MYLGTCYLKLLCYLAIYLIGKVHIVLQTFLFGTYALKSDITVGIEVVGISALGIIIFLLALMVEFFKISTIFFSFLDAVVDNILLEFSYYAVGYNGCYFGIL